MFSEDNGGSDSPPTLHYAGALLGHDSDVRCVAAGLCPADSVITGSRDSSARVWTRGGKTDAYREYCRLIGHSSYVGCVCVVPPCEGLPAGLIVTGGHDQAILLFDPSKFDAAATAVEGDTVVRRVQPTFRLSGSCSHQGAVSALAASKFGVLVSGSWDGSARVWVTSELAVMGATTDGRCLLHDTLEGHTAAVWAVAVLPDCGGVAAPTASSPSRAWAAQCRILTAGADRSIRLWQNGVGVRSFSGHTDCVRGLALLSAGEFVSCANDATLRRWSVDDASCQAVLYAHTNYVYGVAVLANGRDLVSCGEDRTVRVWRGDTATQTVRLPARSVWGVCVLDNGDVAAADSDATCRLLTCDAARRADAATTRQFEELVASTQLDRADLADCQVDQLPGVEALSVDGRRDGQTKMVREQDGRTVTCYQWTQQRQCWIRVGEVVGAAGESTEPAAGRQMYDGRMYDFVFSVDVQEGAPPLKLPYNRGEDVWTAAQAFIHRHNLSQQYLEQVANFITTNSGAGGGTTTQQNVSQRGSGDPFTGRDSYVSGSGAGDTDADSTVRHFPQRQFVLFDRANVDGLLSKLLQFNAQCGGDQLPEQQIRQLVSSLSADASTDVNSTDGNSTDGKVTTDSERCRHFHSLVRLILAWPTELVFPALDLLRLAVVRHARLTDALVKTLPDDVQNSDGDDQQDQERSALRRLLSRCMAPAAGAVCQMVAVRVTANVVACGDAATVALSVWQCREQLVAAALSLLSSDQPVQRGLQVAVATLVLNLIVYMKQQQHALVPSCESVASGRAHLVATAATVVERVLDGEAQFRALVALATVVDGNDEAVRLATALNCGAVVARLSHVPEPQRVAQCARQLAQVLARAK